jgi:DNA polymerase-4
MDTSGWLKIIMHIDMDAFFAAIEQAHLPHLKGKPVIVGGSPEGRGVVTTCSYEARQYGIHSAMSAARAVKQCPDGVFVGISAHKYTHVSLDILRILSEFTPQVEPVSIDEAFVDISGIAARYDSFEDLAGQIKKKIWQAHKLTASIGIAQIRLIAKMASGANKPDGLTVIPPGKEKEFLWPQPIRNLWGVGPKSEISFQKLGIMTIGDLAKFSKARLKKHFGICAESLIDLANGEGETAVHPGYEESSEKSMGHEHTFDVDETDPLRLEGTLLHLCEKVGRRLRLSRYKGYTITLKIRLPDFQRLTRASTLPEPTDSTMAIYEIARGLLEKNSFHQRPIRLIGISVSNLEKNCQELQASIIDQPVRKAKSVENVLDKLRDKFGENCICRAGGYVE